MKTETEPTLEGQSETAPATFEIDVPMWVVGLLYFTMISTAVMLFLFAPAPSEPVTVVGTARVSKLGDVLSWDSDIEDVTGTPKSDAMWGSVFKFVPAQKREEAMRSLRLAVENEPKRQVPTTWVDKRGEWKMEFDDGPDGCVVKIARRR